MNALLIAAAVLVAIGTFAGAMLVLAAMLRAFAEQWRRRPRHAQRRGLIGGGLAVLYMAVASAVIVAAPWGPETFLYVFGAAAAAMTMLTAVVALRGIRRQ